MMKKICLILFTCILLSGCGKYTVKDAESDLEKNAEFTQIFNKHGGEEDPVIAAQRFLNIFRQLHSFIFDGTSLRYERVTDSVKFTALTLTYMGLPCLIVTFKSGLVDSYKVFPSGEVYTSDYNFIKILGGKIFICNSLRIVDEVKFK